MAALASRRLVLMTSLCVFWSTIAPHGGVRASVQERVADPCHDELSNVPARPAKALTGSEFAASVQGLTGELRDARVRSELTGGNMPSFLRRLVPLTLKQPDGPHALTLCVVPDYLAVGTDRDFIYVPMGLGAALAVAEQFGAELPTPKLVDAVYAAAAVRFRPQPLPASTQMGSTGYIVRHNLLIGEQRAAVAAIPGPLTSGHKKDLVLTRRLWEIPGRVAIYGWHRGLNAPIQPLSTVHGASYADYSHGVRLISDVVYLDGVARRFSEIIADPALASLVTSDGALPDLTERLMLLRARHGPSVASR